MVDPNDSRDAEPRIVVASNAHDDLYEQAAEDLDAFEARGEALFARAKELSYPEFTDCNDCTDPVPPIKPIRDTGIVVCSACRPKREDGTL